MAEVRPLKALRYNPAVVGSLEAVAAPPYDVIDERLRAELAARSPFNVVEIDLPRADGGDPYLHAQTTLESWRQEGIVVRDREPALWAMTQEYTVPGTSERLTRRGFFCRVRVEDYGTGLIRPHERTQPGPREDRLRLQRATRANLSPIFSLYPDPDDAVSSAVEPQTGRAPDATFTDDEGTRGRLWRVSDEAAIATVSNAMEERELLIADGHHRYETARLYAREVGGDGEHAFVLMFLCSLSDPGLTVLPTHRLLFGLDEQQRTRLSEALDHEFDAAPADPQQLVPDAAGRIAFGYVDGSDRTPLHLMLKDPATLDRLMADAPEPYRKLDTSVLEALVLRDALGLSQEDIARQRGVTYARDARTALEAVESGRADAAFLLAPTPVDRVREVAEAGEPMPPKSTFFYPKVPTGLVFNLLE